MYEREKKGSGGTVTFFIQLISTNITDYSYWRYSWTPSSNWICLSIPWTNFMPPAYGQGASLKLSDVLSCFRAFQWAIVAETQSCTSTGNEWSMDAIEVYGGIIPSTNTPTKTNTPTFTRTFTPSNTFTNTVTHTSTNTSLPLTLLQIHQQIRQRSRIRKMACKRGILLCNRSG